MRKQYPVIRFEGHRVALVTRHGNKALLAASLGLKLTRVTTVDTDGARLKHAARRQRCSLQIESGPMPSLAPAALCPECKP